MKQDMNLPDFENGIYEKNGVVFDQSVDTNIIHPEPRYIIWEPKTDPDLIYTFYIQNMRVFKQLDGVLAGGSEIVVQCAYPESSCNKTKENLVAKRNI